MSGCCILCPRRCRVQRQETLHDGKLAGVCASPRLPVVARAALHQWEEPVISGTRGSGTVFFTGCNLHCVYCQNYGISTLHQGKPVTVERLREIYEELIEKGAHNINIEADMLFEEADYEQCQMIVLPGGLPGTFGLADHEGLCSRIQEFAAAGKKISAICGR